MFSISASAINIGNKGKTYRGSPVNVPVRTGTRNAITENIKYEALIFFFQAMKSKVDAKMNTDNSKSAIHHSY